MDKSNGGNHDFSVAYTGEKLSPGDICTTLKTPGLATVACYLDCPWANCPEDVREINAEAWLWPGHMCLIVATAGDWACIHVSNPKAWAPVSRMHPLLIWANFIGLCKVAGD